MIVFVSYARRDNDHDALQTIEKIVARLGVPYVDDMHGHEAADRRAKVEDALLAVSVFVGVVTPNYLQTPWTRREFALAVHRKVPIIALLPDGRMIDSTAADWPWRREAALVTQAPIPHDYAGAVAQTRSGL